MRRASPDHAGASAGAPGFVGSESTTERDPAADPERCVVEVVDETGAFSGPHDVRQGSIPRRPSDDDRDRPDHAVGAIGKAWSRALIDLLGVTGRGAGRPCFTWGLRESRRSWGDLTILARRYRTDVVFIEFADALATEPASLLLATYGPRGVTLFEDCELWVLGTWQRFEILTDKRRYKLDDAGRLIGRPNNLDEMRARRVALAHGRWAARAAELAAGEPEGWSLIPRDHFTLPEPEEDRDQDPGAA